MLKSADGVLPSEMTDAYARSGTLVMELDLNDAGPESMLGSMVEATLLPEDQSLSEILGPELHAEFMARAEPLGLEPALAERLQPWFAALLLEQLTLAGSGMAAEAGVDMQLAHRAQLDHKPIIALETAAEQLGYFSQLTRRSSSISCAPRSHELDNEGSETATMVRAWQHGDAAELERLMREDAAKLTRALSDSDDRSQPQMAAADQRAAARQPELPGRGRGAAPGRPRRPGRAAAAAGVHGGAALRRRA